MFHKTLDQSSKRYKEHPNVAAIYTNLPRDKAKRPQRTPKQHQLPKVRDFAYDQHDSEINTRDFIASFTHFGFRSNHIRVNNSDLLSKVGVLSYAKKKPLPDLPIKLKARFPGLFDPDYRPHQCQGCLTSERSTVTDMDTVSLDRSGTTETSASATSAMKSPEEKK